MEDTSPQRTTSDTTPSQSKRRWRRLLATMALVVGLLILPRVLASGAIAGVHGKAFMEHRQGRVIERVLLQQPLGTRVTIELFADNPDEGGEPTATFEAVVGETSESAFVEQVEPALEDASYLRVTVGERTERIVLPDVEDVAGRQPRTLRGFLGMQQALEEGATVTVDVFASEEAINPEATLAFTQGVDSIAAFTTEFEEVVREGGVLEVTLPATSQTVDLQGNASRFMRRDVGSSRDATGVMGQRGATPRMGAMRPGPSSDGFMGRRGHPLGR